MRKLVAILFAIMAVASLATTDGDVSKEDTVDTLFENLEEDAILHGFLRGLQDYYSPEVRHLSGNYVCRNAVHLDFSTAGNGTKLEHGDYVKKDEWLGAYGLTIKATSTIDGYTPDGMARIFDTTRPNTKDPDLGSPNRDCNHSGPGVGSGGVPGAGGENCNPQGEGNVLIIQESKKDSPNDNKRGGKITFSFVAPPDKPIFIGLMDIDKKQDGNTYFEIYKEGQPLPLRQDFAGLGDNSIQVEMIDMTDVTQVAIVVSGSFGVRFLDFCKPEEQLPAEPTGPPTVGPTTATPPNSNPQEQGTPTELATFWEYVDISKYPDVSARKWVAGPDYHSFVCGAEIKLEPKVGGGRKEDDTAANGLKLMFCDINNWESQRERLVVEGSYGRWRGMKMCPKDMYVASMEIRFEKWAGRRDETAMNGLRLACASKDFPGALMPQTVEVEKGHWGDWLEPDQIPPLGQFVVAARAWYQSGQGRSDDVALTTIEYQLSEYRMCVTPYGYISCFYAHPGKGCDDEICEAVVCGLDTNCCGESQNDYDTVCARLAQGICQICKL